MIADPISAFLADAHERLDALDEKLHATAAHEARVIHGVYEHLKPEIAALRSALDALLAKDITAVIAAQLGPLL